MVIYKVVAYGRWSHTRSGRYERVDRTSYPLARVMLCSGTIYCDQAKEISEHVTLDVLF